MKSNTRIKYLVKCGKDHVLQAELLLFNNHLTPLQERITKLTYIHSKTDILNGKLILSQEINILWQKQHREKLKLWPIIEDCPQLWGNLKYFPYVAWSDDDTKAALLFTKQRSPSSNAINQTPFNKSLFSSYSVPVLVSITHFHSSNKRVKREVIPYFFHLQPRSSCESSATIPSFRFPFVLFLRVCIVYISYHLESD